MGHHGKSKKQRHRSNEPKIKRKRKDSSTSSSTSSEEDNVDKRLDEIRKEKRHQRKLQKQRIKEKETPEEKRARRLAKKMRKEEKRRLKEENSLSEEMKYTNTNNPFNDPNLTSTFVWGKKLEYEGRGNLSMKEIEKINRERVRRNLAEMEELKRNREAREAAKEDLEMIKRDEERRANSSWEQTEESFHLSQARLRSRIRLKEGRAKPIDFLARYIEYDDQTRPRDKTEEEFELEDPLNYLKGLTVRDFEDLLEDIKVYRRLDPDKNVIWWIDLKTIASDELRKLNDDIRLSNARDSIHGSVRDDVAKIFKITEARFEMSELVQLEPGTFVKRWKIERKLGEGAFGAVYVCSHDKNCYALKVESVNEKVGFLKMELVVLMKLRDSGRTRHFCTIEDKGRFNDFFYIVMTMVGRSLQDLRKEMPKKKFSMGTAISVGIKCLEALEDLHNIGYLHRDVKPGNFAIGRPEVNELRQVYVLDFGMAREYVHADGRMRNPRALTGFRGTVKYAPLSCHILRELCRKDDVESWLYMIVEITCGKLPWRNLVEINAVGIYKKNCRKDKGIKRLFGGCPRKYVDILRICDKTKFFDTPDYARIYEIMNECIKDTNSMEYPYDWEKDSTKPDQDGGTNVVTEYGVVSDYHGQSKMQSVIAVNNQEQQKSCIKSDPLYK